MERSCSSFVGIAFSSVMDIQSSSGIKPEETTWDFLMSYSREDKELAHSILRALEDRGREGWVDLEDIRPASEWLPNILDGIDRSHVLIFCLSPTSLASRVCVQEELRHALGANKKIVPVVVEEIGEPDLPPETLVYFDEIRKLNWIFMREGVDDLEAGLNKIEEAIDTDLDHVKRHTALLWEARQWERDRYSSQLLRGKILNQANAWLRAGRSKEPQPAKVQTDFIAASIQRRRWKILATVLGVLAVWLVLVSWWKSRLLKNYETANVVQNSAYRFQVQKEYPQTQFFADKARTQFKKLGKSDLTSVIKRIPDQISEMDKLRYARSPLPYWSSQTLRPSPRARVRDVLFGPKGEWWAGAGQNGEILVWKHGIEEPSPVPRPNGFKGNIMDIDLSKDGRWLTAGYDSVDESEGDFVVVWQIRPSGHQFPEFEQTSLLPARDILRVAWSPSGKALATICGGYNVEEKNGEVVREKEQYMQVWAVENGQATDDPFPPPRVLVSRPHDLRFCPDGSFLAVACDGQVSLFDPIDRKELGPLKGSELADAHQTCLDFSSDGQFLAVGGTDYRIRIWKRSEPGEQKIKEADNPVPYRLVVEETAHNAGLQACEFDSKGDFLATAAMGEPVKLWRFDGDSKFPKLKLEAKLLTEPVRTKGDEPKVTALAFSPESQTYPEGAFLLTGQGVGRTYHPSPNDYGFVRMWHLGLKSRVLPGRGRVESVDYHSGAGLLVARIDTKKQKANHGHVDLLEFRTGEIPTNADKRIKLPPMPAQKNIESRVLAKVSEDGDRLLIFHRPGPDLGDPCLSLIKLPSMEVTTAESIDPEGNITKPFLAAFSEHRIALVTEKAQVSVAQFDWKTLEPRIVFSPISKPVPKELVIWDFELSPITETETCAVAGKYSDDNAAFLQVFDLASGTSKNLAAILPKVKTFTALAFHPTEPYLAAGNEDRSVYIINLETEKLEKELPGHERSVVALAFDDTGEKLAASSMTRISIWDWKSEKEENVFLAHDRDVVPVLQWKDGSQLISGGEDGNLKMWPIGDKTWKQFKNLVEDEILTEQKGQLKWSVPEWNASHP